MLLAIYKNKLVVEDKIIDIETDTVADFSILVEYLPKNATVEEIKTYFESRFGVNIVKVSPSYNVEKLVILESEYNELMIELQGLVTYSYA